MENMLNNKKNIAKRDKIAKYIDFTLTNTNKKHYYCFVN